MRPHHPIVFLLAVTFGSILLPSCTPTSMFSSTANDLNSTPSSVPVISNLSLSNNVLTLSGQGLGGVTGVHIQGAATNQDLTIISATQTIVLAAAPSAIQLAVGAAYSLLVSSASGASTISFSYDLTGLAMSDVAPGASGNVLTSNGTTWISQAPTAGIYTAGSGIVISSNSISASGITANNLTAGDFSTRITSGTYSIGISGNAGNVSGTILTGHGGTGLTSPGAAGNVLTSNGTSWASQAPTGGGGASPSAANTWTAQQTFSAGASTQGLSSTGSGVFTNSQMNTPNAFNINSTNVTNEFGTPQGGNYATDAITAAITTPSSATVFQTNAIGAYAVNQNGVANATTAGYFSCHMAAQSSGANNGCWAINPIAFTETGKPGKIAAVEADINAYNVGDQAYGVVVNGGSTVSPPNSYGVLVNPIGPGQRWAAVFASQKAASHYGLYLNAESSGINSSSQAISLNGTDASGTNHEATIFSDSVGNILLSPAPSQSVVSAANIQAQNFTATGLMNSVNGYQSNGVTGKLTLSSSLVTTASTTNTVTMTGMTSSGYCSLTPTNASAAAAVSGTYISAKGTGQITVTHTATAGMTYDVLCTSN